MSSGLESIIDKILPLLQQKMAFDQEITDRNMTLQEQKQSSAVNLEYKKLESQIKSDADKLAWEKEKTTQAIKGNYDLQSLQNSGIINLEKLKQDGAGGTKSLADITANIEKYKVDSTANSAKSTAEIMSETSKYNTQLQTLPTLMKAGSGQKETTTDFQGNKTETYTAPNPQAASGVQALMKSTGLDSGTVTAPTQVVNPKYDYNNAPLKSSVTSPTGPAAPSSVTQPNVTLPPPVTPQQPVNTLPSKPLSMTQPTQVTPGQGLTLTTPTPTPLATPTVQPPLVNNTSAPASTIARPALTKKDEEDPMDKYKKSVGAYNSIRSALV